MADANGGSAAVYVAWITFKNALDQLAQGVPNRIDRSVFPGLSGGVQAQLLAGMRFLALIDADGKPQPSLTRLVVADETMRKRELRKVLEDRYSHLFALDLQKTTPAELGEKMQGFYQVSGDTRDKAVRFFLAAADYIEVPVSPLFEKKKRTRTAGVTTRRRAPRSVAPLADGATHGQRTAGTSKTVALKSGGELTLSATLDLFALTSEDRKFVFDLIDKMDAYANANDSEERPPRA